MRKVAHIEQVGSSSAAGSTSADSVAAGKEKPRPLRLLLRGVDEDLGAAARRGVSFEPADGPHLAAVSSSAEEQIAAIGLEPRHTHSGRHLEPLQDLSRSRIDSPQIALVTFPGGVPEPLPALSVDLAGVWRWPWGWRVRPRAGQPRSYEV